jgi:RNA polymerase sigma-70 factor (ECF subfamily)
VWSVSDDALLAGLGTGDRAAAQAFVERFRRRVFGLAKTIVHDDRTAEDVAQEAFLRAWRHADAYDARRGTVVTWLLTITHNSAMTLLRASREVSDLDAVTETEDAKADPSAELFAEFESTRIHAAIAKLTVEQQQVIFLRFFEGLPHEEVARRLKSNSNAVRATQFRALGRLRKLLQEVSVAQSA